MRPPFRQEASAPKSPAADDKKLQVSTATVWWTLSAQQQLHPTFSGNLNDCRRLRLARTGPGTCRQTGRHVDGRHGWT
jgi:hypothetical protein